jgi:hypothetical protein
MGIIDTVNILILYNFRMAANKRGRHGGQTPQPLTPLPDTPPMKHAVADLCREQNVTIPELAQRSGLDENRAAAIALGRWTPSPTERQRIAAALGVAVDDIAWGHQTPIQHLYGHGPG